MREGCKTLWAALTWALGENTSASSRAFCSALVGISATGGSIPHDAASFGRCVELLIACPELRTRFEVVADASPRWAPIIGAWDELERLYLDDDEDRLTVRLVEVCGA